MKKSNLFPALSFALAAAMSLTAPLTTRAQVPDYYNDAYNYDNMGWGQEGIMMIKLFTDTWEEGRTYPTTEDFNSIGVNYIDLEIVRSHTRLRPIIKDASRDIISDLNHDRTLWTNFPAGNGIYFGGNPSSTFDQDVFSFWNYTHIFGPYNYALLQAPGAWVDAAHKNGTRMYGGIDFFDPDDCTECVTYDMHIRQQNNDGTYKYSRPVINAASYFGNDGYDFFFTGNAYQPLAWRQFHSEVMGYARELGLTEFGLGQYTLNSSLTSTNAPAIYGNPGEKIFDCMLTGKGVKLAWQTAPASIEAALSTVGTTEGLYQTAYLPQMATDYWTEMNTEDTRAMNIGLWGGESRSQFFHNRVGDTPMEAQENYQILLEKSFSGANRNPLNRLAINNNWGAFQVTDASQADTQLNNAPGFCSMVPERTAISFPLPFETHFSLGNGENYFYKGKVTHGSWYNMSQQDIVPTYRWLVTRKGDMTTASDDIDVRFTHEDAYMAGSSLKLTGATTEGADVILYRTALQVSAGNPMLTLAVKGERGATNLSVILKKQGATEWIEVPFGSLSGTTWEKKILAISGLNRGDVIENIGLRVNSSNPGYKLYVGKLRISDDRNAVHAPIREGSLLAEVRQEYTTQLSLRLGWQPDYDGFDTSINDFGMVYNDEINVDHFEIFYKEGQDGPVREVGRTAQWATFIGNLPCTQTADAYIGVRSVSVDLIHHSPIEWVRIPHADYTLPELPEDAIPAESIYKDSRDKGEPKQPEYMDGNIYGTGIEGVTATGEHSTVTVADGVAYFANTEKAWFYDTTGRFVKYVDGAESADVSDLHGVYIVKLLNDHVIRPAKIVVK